MKRIAENPPTRFPARSVAEAEAPWWVAKVKPRQEKACAFDFARNDIEYYLPMFTKVTRRRDNNKPRKSIMPLFPGYIAFSQVVPQNVFSTGRVVEVIEVRHQKRFIEELSQIYVALEAGAVLEPVLGHFEPGATVRVRSGPLHGIVGMVTRLQGEHRLVLSVESFGRAALTIDTAMVEPL
jgi:transcription antitermination factor NusG